MSTKIPHCSLVAGGNCGVLYLKYLVVGVTFRAVAGDPLFPQNRRIVPTQPPHVS